MSGSQQPLISFLNISPEDSFTPNYILDIAQDDQGFLWFSSLSGGLARFDGYDFKTYQYTPGDPTGLPSNQVNRVYVDPQGGIWLATPEGLVWLDTNTDQLTVYRHDPNDPGSLIYSFIGSVLRDSRGDLWVGTEKGLSRLVAGADAFTNYSMMPDDYNGDDSVTPPTWVWDIFEDSTGEIWFGLLGGGLVRFDPATEKFTRYAADPDDPGTLPYDAVRTIYEDSSGILWVGTDRGLAVLEDRATGRFRRIELLDQKWDGEPRLAPVWDIEEDSFGNLWFSTVMGGALKLAGSETFHYFAHDPGDSTSLGPGTFWKIFTDHTGTVWFGTDVIGRVVPSSLAFSQVPAPETIRNDEVELLVDSEGVIWFGTLEGLRAYNPQNEEWQHYLPSAKGEDVSNWVGGAGIYESRDGRRWVVTPKRLNLFDQNTGVFIGRDLPASPNAMTMASTGLIWAALAFHGLAAYDFDRDHLEIYRHDPSDPSTISHDFGYLVLEDEHGQIWYGNVSGLDRLNPASRKVHRYQHDPARAGSLSNSVVRNGLQSADGQLWFATEYGLNRYDADNDAFVHYYNGSSPAANNFLDLVEDTDGSFWLVTHAGLSHFNPALGQFRNWGHADGVPTGFAGTIAISPEGTLYGVSPAGIVIIDPQRLDSETLPPPVVITEFRMGNQPVHVSSPDTPSPLSLVPSRLNSLNLEYQHDQVSFGFSALDYRDPRSNEYAYRLLGLHDDWVLADSRQRVAVFTDLPAGQYDFQVRGSNKDGVWNTAGLSLPIEVLPAPWRTWWAYLLYALAALMLLSLFVRWRTGLLRVRADALENAVHDRTERLEASETRVRQQRRELERLLELKERLFANVSHEFRTPLTLMLGPIEHARTATSNPVIGQQLAMAQRNGLRVLRLVDQLLELSRLRSDHKVTKSPQPVAPVVEAVLEAFLALARDSGIALTLETDDSVWCEMPVDALERVVMNLVSNAVKFTDAGGSIQVLVRNSADKEQAVIAVADTGAGISPEMHEEVFQRFNRGGEFGERIPGSGIGLTLVQELVEAYGGSISLESQPGAGSEFTVHLPAYEPTPGVRIRQDIPPSEALKLELSSLQESKPGEQEGDEQVDAEKAHVLVIDDNADMRSYLAQSLSLEYNVQTAGTGESGLKTADLDLPDLVICDLMMPGMDGFEVARRLRTNERTSHIPIVMLTARSDDESRLQGLREHVDDYLVKPFNDDELALRIANLLAIRDILKARFSSAMISGEEPPAEALNAPERKFLERLHAVLETHYRNPDLTVASMASELAMSERQLQRKLRAVTDMTPQLYLRLFRLRRSLPLLKDGHRVSEVTFDIGFSSPAYFSNCFRAQFGCTPSEYQQKGQTAV